MKPPHPPAPRILSRWLRDQRGAVLPVMAAFLAGALGLLALSVDLGRAFAVRGELQRVADAAALAGALRLITPPEGLSGLTAVTLDFNRAHHAATALNPHNRVDAGAPDSLTLTFGTWQKTDSQPPTFTPTGCSNPAILNAVEALAQKNLSLYFGGILTGSPTLTLRARAVALMGPVGEMPTGTFPLAIDRSAVPSSGRLVVIRLNPSPENNGCWHTFKERSVDAHDLKNLVNGTTPAPHLKVGDYIWVNEGVKNSVLQELERQLAARGGTWEVVLPVIPGGPYTGSKEVLGFAPIRLTLVDSHGGDKRVEGVTLTQYATPLGIPGGPVYYGLWASFPRLVQ